MAKRMYRVEAHYENWKVMVLAKNIHEAVNKAIIKFNFVTLGNIKTTVLDVDKVELIVKEE